MKNILSLCFRNFQFKGEKNEQGFPIIGCAPPDTPGICSSGRKVLFGIGLRKEGWESWCFLAEIWMVFKLTLLEGGIQNVPCWYSSTQLISHFHDTSPQPHATHKVFLKLSKTKGIRIWLWDFYLQNKFFKIGYIIQLTE